MITSKTRETRHSGALSRVQDNKPASPHTGCCLTPKCPPNKFQRQPAPPQQPWRNRIFNGGGDIKIGFPSNEKWHAWALSLARANPLSFTPIGLVWAPNRFPRPSLTLTLLTDRGASPDTRPPTSQPHGTQSCSKVSQKLRNACFLTLVAKHDGSLRLNFEVE